MKNKNLEILVLIGIPASGKSTWSKEFIKNNPNYVRVNRDDLRFMLKDQPVCEQKIEDMVTNLVNLTTREALKKKLNVILDATHLKQKYIDQILEEFKYEADINFRLFDISLSKAIERDANREKKVGEEVIKRMYDQYKVFVDSFNFKPHTKLGNRLNIQSQWSNEKPNAIIVDIDGTLSIMKDRGPFDWDKVDRDEVNHPVADFIEVLSDAYDSELTILLLSGRDGSCRMLTEFWLTENKIPYDHLLMRKEGDYRKDSIIKEEILHNYILPNYNVLYAIDDRLQVVKDCWFKNGIFCFCVNQGLIEY